MQKSGLVQGYSTVPGHLKTEKQLPASCPLWSNKEAWVDSAHPPTHLGVHQPHRALPQPMSLPGPGPAQPASLFLLLPHSPGTGLWGEAHVSEGVWHTPAQGGAHAGPLGTAPNCRLTQTHRNRPCAEQTQDPTPQVQPLFNPPHLGWVTSNPAFLGQQKFYLMSNLQPCYSC